MFAAESRITMTTFTAIVVFTCTWLFANADPTTCPQALDCMKNDSKCPSKAEFTCLSDLRGTCIVNESKVTFKDLLPYMQNMCDAFKVHLCELSSCETFKPCYNNITLTQILDASPEEQIEMSGLLVSSDTFCSFLEDVAACVINEEEAGRCAFSTELANYMMDTKQSLTKLCGGNGTVAGLVVSTALILIGAAIASFAK